MKELGRRTSVAAASPAVSELENFSRASRPQPVAEKTRARERAPAAGTQGSARGTQLSGQM